MLYRYRYIYIYTVQYKHLNIVRHEPLKFRLPFEGHGIPWICPQIGPLVFVSRINSREEGCLDFFEHFTINL